MSLLAHTVEPLNGIEPVEAFLALRSLPHCVWLDSAMQPPRGRLSVVAADPVLVIRSKRSTVFWRGDGFEHVLRANPFASLEHWLGRVRPASQARHPLEAGTLIGYFGYELKNHLEHLPQKAVDDLRLPDMWWGVYDALLVFDHMKKQAHLISTGLTERGDRDPTRAQRRAAQFSTLLKGRDGIVKAQAGTAALPNFSEPQSNFTKQEYLAAVRRAKDYIAAGDVYQINLSQRFESRASAPLSAEQQTQLYLKLRETNPAPFAAFLDIGDAAILSSSPECFLDISGRMARTFPIKGTRPRGAAPAEDARLAQDLRQSKKDHAELVMIVDLERNDLGRVCEFGTVQVPDLGKVESYSTVHHLVATVEGRLREGVSHLDGVRACFPGGSITGTPKIRAMQIIDELEPHARGVYTGAIGMMGLADADGHQQTMLNIAIRTMTVKGGRVVFHSGGGIIADSEPEAEFEETLHKARGMKQALL
jgi:para-aminobenzoate synthetase component 1